MFSVSSCQTEPVAMIYNQTVRNLKWKIVDGRLQTGFAYISASILDSNEIQTGSNRYTYVFGVQLSKGTNDNDVRPNRRTKPVVKTLNNEVLSYIIATASLE